MAKAAITTMITMSAIVSQTAILIVIGTPGATVERLASQPMSHDRELGTRYHRQMDVEDLAAAVAESTLTPLERVRFLNLCEARSPEMLAEDRDRVAGHVSLMEAAQALNNLVDIELARAIGDSLDGLLVGADSLSFEERRLLAGAVEYFVLTGDSDNDMASPVGLLDDARVTNATARALGRPGLVIPMVD